MTLAAEGSASTNDIQCLPEKRFPNIETRDLRLPNFMGHSVTCPIPLEHLKPHMAIVKTGRNILRNCPSFIHFHPFSIVRNNPSEGWITRKESPTSSPNSELPLCAFLDRNLEENWEIAPDEGWDYHQHVGNSIPTIGIQRQVAVCISPTKVMYTWRAPKSRQSSTFFLVHIPLFKVYLGTFSKNHGKTAMVFGYQRGPISSAAYLVAGPWGPWGPWGTSASTTSAAAGRGIWHLLGLLAIRRLGIEKNAADLFNHQIWNW